jgi:hypothetical protein
MVTKMCFLVLCIHEKYRAYLTVVIPAPNPPNFVEVGLFRAAYAAPAAAGVTVGGAALFGKVSPSINLNLLFKKNNTLKTIRKNKIFCLFFFKNPIRDIILYALIFIVSVIWIQSLRLQSYFEVANDLLI